jgi:tetratricopeptide (TPR) repeat protein
MRDEDDPQDIAVNLNNLGEVLFRKGDINEASEALEQAYSAAESAFGDEHPVSKRIRANLEKVRDRVH